MYTHTHTDAHTLTEASPSAGNHSHGSVSISGPASIEIVNRMCFRDATNLF